MINKKIVAGILISGILTAWVWATFANDTNINSKNMPFFKNLKKWSWMEYFKGGLMKNNLTNEEKIALNSMTDEQKIEFYNKKTEEQLVKRGLKESVIDTLLAWGKLTSEQEVIRNEIIKERAEMKAKMEEFKTIMEKRKAWETLTNEEESMLEGFKYNKKGKHFWKLR